MNYSKFTQVPQDLLESAGCSTHRVRVYGLLLRRSRNGNRPAYGGRISIAEQLGVAQSTVQEALSWLESTGIIRKVFQSIGGRGIANIYCIVVAGYRAVRTLVSSLASKLTGLPSTKEKEHIRNEGKIKNIVGNSPNSPPDPRIQHIRALRNQIQNM